MWRANLFLLYGIAEDRECELRSGHADELGVRLGTSLRSGVPQHRLVHRHFREKGRPHVARAFIRPPESDGIRVVHCDIRESEDVDEVGEMLDPRFPCSTASI
jgi:hypothetical protein